MFTKNRPAILNRNAKKCKVEEIFKALGDISGQVVGDIGAGGGYFSFLFSEKVGDLGFVYAIDVVQSNLDYIKDIVNKRHMCNVSMRNAP